jgi:hypothetical protein
MMTRESIRAELGLDKAIAFLIWRSLVRFVAPFAILAIFAANIFGN